MILKIGDKFRETKKNKEYILVELKQELHCCKCEEYCYCGGDEISLEAIFKDTKTNHTRKIVIGYQHEFNISEISSILNTDNQDAIFNRIKHSGLEIVNELPKS